MDVVVARGFDVRVVKDRESRRPGGRTNQAHRAAFHEITDIEVIELRVPGQRGDSFDGSHDNCVLCIHADDGITSIAVVDPMAAIVRVVIEASRSHTP
jgi:hypothetical protein